MLTNEASHVRAVGAGLAPEARRVGGVPDRQLPAIENLAAMHVRQRHFGRGHEVQIPFTRDLE